MKLLPSYCLKTIFIALFFLMNATACQQEPKPLSQDRMGKILTEMHIAESYAQFLPKDSDLTEIKNKDSLKKYIASILTENKTTETEFKQSMDWYKSRPELLDSVYQQVLSNIAIWQSKTGRK